MLCRSPGAGAGWGSQGLCTGPEPVCKCRFANPHLLAAVINLFIIEGIEAISAAVEMVFLTLAQVVSHI